jgi:hypothetical protein
VAAGQAGFEQKNEIVHNEDGTLVSRRSLLGQAGKQMAGDAGASFDNAREAVEEILGR